MKKFTEKDLECKNNEVLASNYGREFEIITEALNKYKYNNDKSIIALKVALIDITNSTNINRYKSKITLNELVDVIYNIKDFDKRLSEGDHKLIKEIAVSNGKINLFSFATKYCCYHNTVVYGNDDYSIYDSILRDHLPEYIDNISKYKIDCWRKEMDYDSYHNCITQILENNNIKIKDCRRKFDRFIWWSYRGREV